MDVRRAIPVLTTADPDGMRSFYEEFLGFEIAMHEDGMMMLKSASVPTTQVIIAWPSPTAVDPELLDVDISIEVSDVDAAHAIAIERGLEVVRELRDEVWEIRRFFVRDPGGRVVNVASHR